MRTGTWRRHSLCYGRSWRSRHLKHWFADILSLAAAIAAILVGFAAARAAECPDGQPEKAKTGEPAACSGVILSQTDALALAARAAGLVICEAERDRAEAERDSARRETVLARDHGEAEVASCEAQKDTLSRRLDQRQDLSLPRVAWHERPEFVAPITAAVTGAVVALLVYAFMR